MKTVHSEVNESHHMTFPRSKLGLVLVMAYLGVALYCDFQAFTYSDFAGFFASIPFGLILLAVFRFFSPDAFVSSGLFTNWLFIGLTIAGNVVIYYWLGSGVANSVAFARRSKSALVIVLLVTAVIVIVVGSGVLMLRNMSEAQPGIPYRPLGGR
jgi:hypothetical protein